MSISPLLVSFALAGALQGTPSFDEGVTAYGALDYEGAVAKFKATDTAATDAERATLLLWIALCDAGIGDLDAARASMREALKLDHTVALPTTVSPRVVAIYDEEKAAVPAAAEPVVDGPPSPPLFDFAAVSPFVWAGGASLAGGVVALGGAALWTGAAFEQLGIVDNPDTFQSDAKVALDSANGNALLAIGAGAVGVTLASVGVVLLAMSAQPDEAPPVEPAAVDPAAPAAAPVP